MSISTINGHLKEKLGLDIADMTVALSPKKACIKKYCLCIEPVFLSFKCPLMVEILNIILYWRPIKQPL